MPASTKQRLELSIPESANFEVHVFLLSDGSWRKHRHVRLPQLAVRSGAPVSVLLRPVAQLQDPLNAIFDTRIAATLPFKDLQHHAVGVSRPQHHLGTVGELVTQRNLVPLAEDMAISKDKLYATIGLARATVNRKLREQQSLNQDESERVLGMARLVGQVSTIVGESGNPEGFDAAKWVAAWLDRPLQALGGRRPAELMDTADGRGLVSDLVARMQTGAYA